MKIIRKENYDKLSQEEMKQQEMLVAKCFNLKFEERETYSFETLGDLYQQNRIGKKYQSNPIN